MHRTDDALRDCLERIYSRYNRRELIHPDPLEFLWNYQALEDREIVGLLASGLAYGRVTTILKSISAVLDVLGDSPSRTLRSCSREWLEKELKYFKHRFTTSDEMVGFLLAASSLQSQWGLLGNLMASLMDDDPYGIALDNFAGAILERAGMDRCSLLPRPGLGSACKRLNLFMRWMVRSDDVDPGGWTGIPPSVLTVPVDVHMYRISSALGFTSRKTADGRTAREITEGFGRINPKDPVKYDFALTRMGIQGREEDDLFCELRDRHCTFVDS